MYIKNAEVNIVFLKFVSEETVELSKNSWIFGLF